MSDKDIQLLMELAEQLLEQARSFTKEQALESLITAGILDKDGNLTPPYLELAEERG